jgi:hypothetical protein
MIVETLGVSWLVVRAFMFAVTDEYETGFYHWFIPLLISLVLVGWLAVDYEIVQVLRLEGKPRVLPPADPRQAS